MIKIISDVVPHIKGGKGFFFGWEVGTLSKCGGLSRFCQSFRSRGDARFWSRPGRG